MAKGFLWVKGRQIAQRGKEAPPAWLAKTKQNTPYPSTSTRELRDAPGVRRGAAISINDVTSWNGHMTSPRLELKRFRL